MTPRTSRSPSPCPEGKFLREHLGSVIPLPTSPVLSTPAPTQEELSGQALCTPEPLELSDRALAFRSPQRGTQTSR